MGQRRRVRQGDDDHLLTVLNAEWDAMVEVHSMTLACWAERHPELHGCRDLEQILTAIRASPDRTMLVLLREHRAGGSDGELAGRVVLQTMLGKMVRMAAGDPRAGLADYITQLWLVIQRYPVDRRPYRVAANLALDTLKGVVAEDPARRAGVSLSLVGDPQKLDRVVTEARDCRDLDHNVVAGVSGWRAVTTAWQLGLIDGQERDVLLHVYVDGCSGRQAAERLQISTDMVRQRCCQAKRRLVAHRAELAVAA